MSKPVDPRLVRAVPSLRRLMLVLGVGQLAGALLTIAQAGLLAVAISAIFERRTGQLPEVLLTLAAVGVGRAAIAGAQEWTTARASTQVRAALRARVLDAVVRLGPRRAAQQPEGRLVAAAGPGLEALDGYVTRAIPALVSAAVVPLAVLAAIGFLDWTSAVVLVVALPLVPLFMILVGKTTKRLVERRYAAMARLSGHFVDLVRGLPTLKIYGRAQAQIDTVRRASEAYRAQTMTTLRVAFLSGLVLDLIATLSVAVVAVNIGLRLDDGRLGLRTALFVLLLAPELFTPLRALGAQHHSSEEGRASATAALDVIDDARGPHRPATTDTPCPAPRPGALYLHDVTVAHPGRNDKALDHVELTILAGQTVALQGRSGAGKSTLIDCLLRFTDPTGGHIAVGTATGDVALAGVDSSAWRARLAWVPQRPRPTQRTVGAEVALGDPHAGADEIRGVIADCHAPHPDTPLGEDGQAVSAGQRRRIALARALLRARACLAAGIQPLMLLDEPSEDLDRRTEEVIASVISALHGRATIVMATHSPRLAALADRRIVLADGHIVEVATQAAGSGAVAAAWPAAAKPNRPSSEATPASLADIVDRRRAAKGLAWAGLLSGAAGVAGLALTATSVWLICRAAQHPNVQALEVAVVGVRAFALAKALLRYVERLVSHDRALRLLTEVRARVFAALEPLVPSATGDLRRGDLLRRFVSDVDGVQEGLVRAVIPLLGASVAAVASVTVAFLVAPTAGLALAAGLAFGSCVVPLVVRRIAGPGRVLTAAAGERDVEANGLLDGLPELTAYGATDLAFDAVVRGDARVHAAARRPALAAAAGVALIGISAALTMPLVLALGAHAVATNGVRPIWAAVLGATVLVSFEALAPLPNAFAAWGRFRAGFDRIADLLGARPAFREPATPIELVTGPTGLRLTGVAVAPSVTAQPVLADANLALLPGKRVLITGPSGSGKSTLLAAALRLVPATAGGVDLLCGSTSTDLASVGSGQLPPRVAGSLQGDHVFNASLADNLRVVCPEASDDDLDRVARAAGLAHFLTSLDAGWLTPAGPDGAELSGGQRQRLLLARALLADPDVLVLDEPTAHLDEATEREVLRDVLAGTRGRTVLMSTHRVVGREHSDAVMGIDDGMLASVAAPADSPDLPELQSA